MNYDNNSSIAILKKKIKEEKPNDYKNVDTDHLIAWGCKEPKLLAVNKLENINLSDCRKAVWLASMEMMVSLKLSKNEIILV